MYIPIADVGKFAKRMSYFNHVNNWTRKDISKSYNPEEIYVRNVKASLKNKKEEQEFLMQLINPEFSSIIEVYADPNTQVTTGVRFGGGLAIGGGTIKSYYVKKGNQVLWLKKSEFEDHYEFLFGNNEAIMKKYPYKSIKWDYLSFLIYQYTKMSS